MTLNAIYRWKHPDATSDMNKRLQTLVPRGIFDGGVVTPGVGLTVTVSPSKALSYDGMYVEETATQTLSVLAGQTNYAVLRAKYVTGTTPTLSWEVLDQVTYNGDAEKDYLIVYGTVVLAGGAVSVAAADISLQERDVIDPLGRGAFRGVIDNPGLLPTAAPVDNRDGDLYFVLNPSGVQPGQTWYFWEASTTSWQVINTGSYNVETGSMGDVLVQGERNRKEQGSGILAGVRPANDFASELDLTLIEIPTVADQVGIDTFSAAVNGHYVQPYSRYITLPAKPGVGTRYDLIFLEVYREAIAVPENHTFARNPDGTLTYTLTQISDKLEQVAWQAGIAGDNFDLNELQADDHNWVVTKYRFATVQNVTTASLYDNTAAASSALNVDGNAFSATPGTGIDPRVWQATAATTSADGVSWAIPLYVVKRTAAEDHTIGEAVKEYRNDVRFIFPVYPVADTAVTGRYTTDNNHRGQPTNATLTPAYDDPSGFLTEMDWEITSGGANNTIHFYDFNHGGVKVRVRGVEDYLTLPGGSNDVGLGAAPLSGYERVLVYLKLSQTLYADSTSKALTVVSDRHRPWFPSDGSTLIGQGWKRGYVTWEVVVENLGAAATELDEDDSMTAAGWTKGDQSLVGSLKYEDGGIWSKAVAIDVDDRIHPLLYEWAIPITLVHRRNQAAWNYSTNPNGTGSTRPDSRTAYQIIHPDDLVDLRRLAGVDAARLTEMLEKDVDMLMRGALRTRMAEKWAGAGTGGAVAGTRILQSDITDSLGSSPAFSMPGPGNSRKIWSDAREFVPVSTSFALNANYSDDLVTYTVATGQLDIKAPTGAHLIRALPSTAIVDATSTNTTYLDFLGEPCWTTQDNYSAAFPTPTKLKYINVVSGGATHEEQDVFGTLTSTEDPAFSVAATDTYGRATTMSVTLASIAPYASADIATVSFWVHYDRSLAGTYVSNYGLSEIPDVVHSAVLAPNTGTPSELNIGALYTIVRKTVAASSSFTITSADVLAASGTSGATATMVAFGAQTYSASLGGASLSTVGLDSAQTTMTFTYSAPITTDVEVVIYYYTDVVTKWVEVGRGGKSLRGVYEWHEEDIDFGGVPATPYAFDVGNGTWHNVETAGSIKTMPVVWTSSTGTTGPWTWLNVSSLAVGHRQSNLVSFNAGALISTQYAKVVVPKWSPPAAGTSGEMLLHYTYTPYQGLSGAGAVANPVAAVPKLEKMLHGRVEANTDCYVSQSGACSVYGGVDSWSGSPARVPNQEDTFGSDRFSVYNQTQLVKGTKANGAFDLHTNAGATNTLYAAAIMRLPYPVNPAMVTTSGALGYHVGTQDWDIDPGREGASTGFFNYAPGYLNGMSRLNLGNGLHYDQFVNGVSRLAIPGEPKQQDMSVFIPSSDFQNDTTTLDGSTGQVFSAVVAGGPFYTHGWVLGTDDEKLYGDSNLNCRRGNVTALVATKIKNLNTGDLQVHHGVHFGLHNLTGAAPFDYVASANSFEYTSPVSLTATNEVHVCTFPGTLHAWANFSLLESYPILYIRVKGTNATTNNVTVYGTFTTQEAPRSSYILGISPSSPGINATINTDLIRVPLGSFSLSAGISSFAYGVSGSSLVGRNIGYPASWGVSTKTTLTGLILASTSIHSGYGRGLYLGSTTKRLSMPVFVPGSGTTLYNTLTALGPALIEKAAQPPDAFPVGPASSPFATSPKRWLLYDHGGPVAYSFHGLVVNPSSTEYSGQAVIQIAGGPSMGTGSDSSAAYTSDLVDGTAIDAFWPSRRPLVKPGQ